MKAPTSHKLKVVALVHLLVLLAACSSLSEGPAKVIEPAARKDFDVSLSRQTVFLTGGRSAQIDVTVLEKGGFEDEVALSVHGLQRGVISSFKPNTTDKRQLTLATKNRWLRTSALVTVRGTSDDTVREAQFRLLVVPASTFPRFWYCVAAHNEAHAGGNDVCTPIKIASARKRTSRRSAPRAARDDASLPWTRSHDILSSLAARLNAGKQV